MQDHQQPLPPATADEPTLTEELISFLRAVVAFCTILFIIPTDYFLFDPYPVPVMILWDCFGLTVSAVALTAYIRWDQKGKAPFVLPYTPLGIAHIILYAIVAIFVSAPYSLSLIHMAALAIMGFIAWLAEKHAKRIS